MSGHRHHSPVRRWILAGGLLVCVILVIYLAGQDWSSRYHEERESGNQAFMEEGIVSWNGKRYRKKPALSLILLGGIDKESDGETAARTSNYRNGGQADFLLLLAIDHGEKQIYQLQIDRDTMTEVMVLGVYGNETGTREMQICLAHSFGANREDNAKYTVDAVRGLLDGLEIDGYYMVDYSAVSTLTDALGGVTVTIPEDMTSVNPEWYKGHTITLQGKDAETFVRTRETVGAGTNAERMNRQASYIRGAISKMNQNLSRDNAFAGEFLATMRQIATTNLSEQALAEEINESHSYEVQPIDYLPGEYTLSDSGFVEFYPEEGSPTEWIMTHLYSER